MAVEQIHSQDPGSPLLLSVDFEDWHQLVRRRVGAHGWQQPGPALGRETEALLALLRGLRVRATFFILGMAARAHPELVLAIVGHGHEIACHGDCHRPVHSQTPREFAADLSAARSTIEQLTGRALLGYRAPAFSITRDANWAYEVLADQGFAYDSSQNDSPRIRRRVTPVGVAPHPLELPGGRTLWEFPLAVWRTGRGRLPVGGASYWRVMPRALVLQGLRRAGPMAGLYLHPHELDPQPLRPLLSTSASISHRAQAKLRAVQRNAARRRAPETLRAIAERFQLIPYGEAYARLTGGAPARP
jgi:polysaccharide deacetylase family protein (PEP-CTERM system associated)